MKTFIKKNYQCLEKSVPKFLAILAILLLSFSMPGFAQTNITGKVIDVSSNEPMAGVTIQVKGTLTGTISGSDGSYRLNVSNDATLVFSFVGYQTQEIAVSGRAVIDIIMNEEVTALDEVIVTGYSAEKKKDIIGSVSVVNTDEMLTTPSGNLSTQLQGRVAGITISTSGDPGSASKVRVRGFGSFSGSDPLYIIDGVPGSIDRLNSNDIESVQVLKDAASASVYGARAASGVVIITTKQGKAGTTKVNIDSYYGINYVSESNFPDLLNSKEYGNLIWAQMKGAGREVGDPTWGHVQYGNGENPVIPEYILVNINGTPIGGAALETMKISDPDDFAYYTNPDNYSFTNFQIVKSGNTDWFDEIYNPAPIQNHNLSVSGGSEKGKFILGLNYFNEKATSSKYTFFERYSLRANSQFNILESIRLGENLQVSYNNRRNAGGGGGAWDFPSLIPVYDIAGNPASSAAPGLVATGGSNPVTEAWRNRFDGSNTWGVFGNIYLEIDLLKDIVLRSSYGIDYYNTFSRDLSQRTYEHYQNTTTNSLSWQTQFGNMWTWTNTLNYAKTLGSSSFKLLLGTEAVNDISQNFSASRLNYNVQDKYDFQVLNSGTGTRDNSGTRSRQALFSLLGRIDYSYADRYIVNATIRRDGSSKFGSNNRYGYFPSVALGWRLSSEGFMSSLTWLTDLKLRASWGIIGNQTGLPAENQYSAYTQTEAQSYPIAGTNNSYAKSFTLSQLGNPDARWEKTITTNIGIDATMLSGKINVGFDYFIKEIQDLLVQNQAPTTGPGATQPQVNVGNMKNKGVDLTVINRGNITGELEYEVSLNFSAYRNEITRVMDNPAAVLYGGNTRMGDVTITKTGQPISTFYGYQIEGFFNTQEELDEYLNNGYQNTWLTPKVGRWRIADISGPNGTPDKVINDFDRTNIGNPHPDFQVGMNIALTYRNLDFSAFLFWNQGGEIFNSTRYGIDFNTFQYQRSARMLYDSWSSDNTGAALPKLDINDVESNKYATSYFVEDATYVRFKTLQLGYTIPQSLMSKVKVERLRLYLQAQNILTFTKFSGLDPDIGISGSSDLSMGVGGGNTPTPKQIIFGLNLAF